MGHGITLGILAGGRGARLGGADKAMLRHDGATLLARTLAAFAAPGDDEVLVSHRDPGAPSRLAAGDGRASMPALRVVQDLRPGQPGPLAGLEALLASTHSRWLLTTPVDLRDVPAGLAARLRAAAAGIDTQATVVRDADGLQPLVALWPVATTLAAVRVALDAHRLSARDLVAAVPHAVLDLAPARLGNLNTPEDFSA